MINDKLRTMMNFIDQTVDPVNARFEDGSRVRVRDHGVATCVKCVKKYTVSLMCEQNKKKPWHCNKCAKKGLGGQPTFPENVVIDAACIRCNNSFRTTSKKENERTNAEIRFTCRTCRKEILGAQIPRRNTKRNFTCIECNSIYIMTIGAQENRHEYLRGKCKKCAKKIVVETARRILDSDADLPFILGYYIDYENVTAYDGITRKELLFQDYFDTACLRCNKIRSSRLVYERQKVHPWLCKSCSALSGWSNEEARENLKRVMREYCAIHPPTHNGGKQIAAKTINGEDIVFKSSFEFRFAEYLNSKKIVWEYEKQSFPLTVQRIAENVILDETYETSYWPDFYIKEFDLWIEIKGYFYLTGKLKWEEFCRKYPGNKILLFENDIKNLEENSITLKEMIENTQ